MTRRQPPRFALALLERLVPGSTCMAGDLIERYEQRASRWGIWGEVLAAIAIEWVHRTDEIRPLRLVDLQPADAIERTRRFGRRGSTINLTGSPVYGIGGLGIAILLPLMTLVMPAAWGLFIASIVVGILLGVVMISMRRKRLG